MRKAANADFDPSRPSWKETETGTSGAAPLFSALGEITSHRPFLLPATTRKPNQIASIHLHVQMQRTTCKLQRGPSSACTLIRCTTAIAAGKHNSTMGLSSAASRPFEGPNDRLLLASMTAPPFSPSAPLSTFPGIPSATQFYHRRYPTAWQRCGDDSLASKQNGARRRCWRRCRRRCFWP
jgi:hypothetical protein